MEEKTLTIGHTKLTEEVFGELKKFQKLMMMYNCAIKEIQTKFEILNDELSSTHNRNPIEMIKSRVKSPESILGKLNRKHLPISFDSLMNNINDVAGVRVICSFVDDIYEVANMLALQDDINVIKITDYIKNPKDNGYRSYHMIVEVPVFFSNSKQYVKVEVQLRTIAMDFWASLEHKIKYKKDVENAEEISAQLKQCADIISQTDIKMQEINYKITHMD